MEAKLSGVEGQFRNNGGSSMRDAVDRIEKRQIAIEGIVGDIKGEVATHGTELARLADAGSALAARVTDLEDIPTNDVAVDVENDTTGGQS
jgi:hypothetical protein